MRALATTCDSKLLVWNARLHLSFLERLFHLSFHVVHFVMQGPVQPKVKNFYLIACNHVGNEWHDIECSDGDMTLDGVGWSDDKRMIILAGSNCWDGFSIELNSCSIMILLGMKYIHFINIRYRFCILLVMDQVVQVFSFIGPFHESLISIFLSFFLITLLIHRVV